MAALTCKLNKRQKEVIELIFREGVSGFKGGLSAENYIRVTRTTASTATRDFLFHLRLFKVNNFQTVRFWMVYKNGRNRIYTLS